MEYKNLQPQERVTYLKQLHYGFSIFCIRKDFKVLSTMLDSFNATDDVNELRTCLLATARFQRHPLLADSWNRLLRIETEMLERHRKSKLI